MSDFACRYAAEFEAVELLTDAEVRVRVSIGGKQKVLSSLNLATIAKIRDLNPGAGMRIRLYYTDADAWGIAEATAENMAIEKNFRKAVDEQ